MSDLLSERNWYKAKYEFAYKKLHEECEIIDELKLTITSQFIQIKLQKESLESSNQLLRSAFQIAKYKGVNTNWEQFEHNLEMELISQASIKNRKIKGEQVMITQAIFDKRPIKSIWMQESIFSVGPFVKKIELYYENKDVGAPTLWAAVSNGTEIIARTDMSGWGISYFTEEELKNLKEKEGESYGN